MRSKRGIALISTFMILAVVMAFGLGSIFITTSDLKISDNVQANVTAKYRAEARLNASVAALQAEVDAAGGVFPETFSPTELYFVNAVEPLHTQPEDSYTRHSDHEVSLKIAGRAAADALYLGQAALQTPSATLEPQGLVTEGTITIDGWAETKLIDAHVHGASGYAFGNVDLARMGGCQARDVQGFCINQQAYDLSVDADADGHPDALPVTASEGMDSYACAPAADSRLCMEGKPTKLGAPITLELPDPQVWRDELLNTHPCTQHFTSAPTLNTAEDLQHYGMTAGATVCIEQGDLSLPGVDITGVTFIVQAGDINLQDAVTLTDSTLISAAGQVRFQGAGVLRSSLLYSDLDLNLPAGLSLADRSTLISSGTLTYQSRAEATMNGGSAEVGVEIYARGDLSYDSAHDNAAKFYTHSTFQVQQTSCILGSVEAKLGVTAGNGLCLDAGLLAEAWVQPETFDIRIIGWR